MSFKIAKMIVGFTIVKFCKRGCQMGDGGGGGGEEDWSLRIVYTRVALICMGLVWRFSILILKNMY